MASVSGTLGYLAQQGRDLAAATYLSLNQITLPALAVAVPLVGAGCSQKSDDPDRAKTHAYELTPREKHVFEKALKEEKWVRTKEGDTEVLTTEHAGRTVTLKYEPGNSKTVAKYVFDYTGLQLPTGKPYEVPLVISNRIWSHPAVPNPKFAREMWLAASKLADIFEEKLKERNLKMPEKD